MDFWQSAYEIKKETKTTAGSMGYVNSATVEDNTTYEETVQNFGTAFLTNSFAFKNLLQANQQMDKNVADNLSELQNQVYHLTAMMQNMSTNTQFRQPSPQYMHPQHNNYQQTKFQTCQI